MNNKPAITPDEPAEPSPTTYPPLPALPNIANCTLGQLMFMRDIAVAGMMSFVSSGQWGDARSAGAALEKLHEGIRKLMAQDVVDSRPENTVLQ